MNAPTIHTYFLMNWGGENSCIYWFFFLPCFFPASRTRQIASILEGIIINMNDQIPQMRLISLSDLCIIKTERDLSVSLTDSQQQHTVLWEHTFNCDDTLAFCTVMPSGGAFLSLLSVAMQRHADGWASVPDSQWAWQLWFLRLGSSHSAWHGCMAALE